MKRRLRPGKGALVAGFVWLCACVSADEPVARELPSAPSPEKAAADAETIRKEEMYQKMRHAVEEVAELYGSPRFVQVFTNDRILADDLRLRLRETDTLRQLKAEAEELAQRCERLKADVAKKEAEVAAVSQRLAKQRAAMAAVANAVDQADRAVEGSAP